MNTYWLKSIFWDIFLKNQPYSRNSFARTVAFQHLPQWTKMWGTHVCFRKYVWLLQKRRPRSVPSRYALIFASKIFARLDLGPAVKTNNSEHISRRGIHMLAHLPNFRSIVPEQVVSHSIARTPGNQLAYILRIYEFHLTPVVVN